MWPTGTSSHLSLGSIQFALLVTTALILAFLIWRRINRGTGHSPLPPGPPGWPVIGNAPTIIKESIKGLQHLLMLEWAREYGEIFKVRIGPFEEYFINTDAAVKELYDRSSSSTSERPRWIVSNEQICNRMNVLLLNASDSRWKHQRKVTLQGLTNPTQADAGLPFLHFETAKFLHELVNSPVSGHSPKDLWKSIGRYTYSTFAAQVFGMEVPTTENPAIEYIYETGEAQIQGTFPGFAIVDIFPMLDNLPLWLKPWERNARARFRRDWGWCQEKLARVRRSKPSESSDLRTAFLHMVLNDEKQMGFDSIEEAAYLALMLVIGAADTSRMSTWSFLDAMMRFPEVQKKAQIEIDKAAPNRLPRYSDLEHIPYVRCIMKEVWRWRPPVALGHPHTTTRDLTYKGYLIPKGARLHLNAYAIGHDPARHEDPERFWPERYADDNTSTMHSINSSDVSKRDHFAFGSGRRVCPGYHVADRSFAVAIMRLLWAFDITPAPGTEMPIDPNAYASEIPGNPGQNMPVRLSVRSKQKAEMIESEFEEELSRRPEMESLM